VGTPEKVRLSIRSFTFSGRVIVAVVVSSP